MGRFFYVQTDKDDKIELNTILFFNFYLSEKIYVVIRSRPTRKELFRNLEKSLGEF